MEIRPFLYETDRFWVWSIFYEDLMLQLPNYSSYVFIIDLHSFTIKYWKLLTMT